MMPTRLAVTLAFSMTFAAAMFAAEAADSADPPTAPAKSVKPASVDLAQARALIAKKDWNAAIVELQRAARAQPDSADVHNLFGYSYRNAGQIDKAFDEYAIALKLDPKHKGAHEYVGVAYLLDHSPRRRRNISPRSRPSAARTARSTRISRGRSPPTSHRARAPINPDRATSARPRSRERR